MKLARRLRDRLRRAPELAFDTAVAVPLAVAAEVEYRLYGAGLGAAPGPDTRVLVILLLTLPLAVRRRYPLACALAQLAGSVLIRAQPPYVAIFAILLGLYSLCVYGPSPWLSLGWVVTATVSLQLFLPGIRMQVAPSVLTLLGGMLAFVGGEATRQRQAHAHLLEERAERLRAEGDLAAKMAVEEERRRIARELHDVVAHSVSLIVVQAGAARMVRGQPSKVLDALRRVEDGGREALEELRHLVGLLGNDQEVTDLEPQPGLGQLEKLAASVRAAGVAVDVSVNGSPRQLPLGLDLTAYRIVQEALTNTLKHAPGASARVRVDFGQEQLDLEVVDTGGRAQSLQPPPGGHGLAGMRERVAMYRGQLEVGPQPGGGFAVRAHLPLPAP
jgi:signal transduction histidine kinase